MQVKVFNVIVFDNFSTRMLLFHFNVLNKKFEVFKLVLKIFGKIKVIFFFFDFISISLYIYIEISLFLLPVLDLELKVLLTSMV